ncbi:MAG TPA: DNA methyltransferase [Anaerolineales bacterium]|nr:DNA methyltransferase [Anaerolineales bacterium]
MVRNQIIQGDCVEVMEGLPPASVDLVFADPPYNLQLRNELHRPNMTRVDAVADDWDRFESFDAYDDFTRRWLAACKRVLKPGGSIWVIGSYHNIFRVGKIMQDIGYWILNDVIWIKTNPMPNFRGVRFTNAHETLIWASTGPGAAYTFNHHEMKALNGDKQMRSDWWLLQLANRKERVRDKNGAKGHSAQKPVALLYRVILASTNPGDLILDPFFGSGTTGAVAKALHRDWIGIEREPKYIELANRRIAAIEPAPFDPTAFSPSGRRGKPRIPFSALLEHGYLQPGRALRFKQDPERTAVIRPDARLQTVDGFTGSIHKTGSHLAGGAPCNGWDHWYFNEGDCWLPLDTLRQRFRTDQGS